MSNSAIEFNGVWKKFKKGETFDSLRDLVPSMAKWMFSQKQLGDLERKEFWALQDVSFRVGQGEALGIIGPNGSGKSTILKLLSRILKPDRGNLVVTGRLGALIELGAGFHPDLTGRENIYLNGTILGMKRAEIDKKFDDIVDFSGLAAFLDTPVKRYSTGMYARLGFAVAVHVDPEVLLVDEVLSVGDYHFQERCFQKMQEFVRKGTTLVFVSHNLTAVSTLCTSALVLKYGIPVYHGEVSGGIQKYHSFYEQGLKSDKIEVLHSRLMASGTSECDVVEPGTRLVLEVEIRALAKVQGAHPGLQVHTADGQCLFVTASSRLTDQKLNLEPGQRATIVFTFDMNLQGNVFLLAFTVSPEIESPGDWIYYNPRLKRVVVTEDRRCAGVLHMDPGFEMVIHERSNEEAAGVSEEATTPRCVTQ